MRYCACFKFYKNKLGLACGFTLAEVLITLIVIGVIAAIAIPALIIDAQEAELKAGGKEAYSILTQLQARAMADNGGSTAFLTVYNNGIVRTTFKDYLSYTKFCTIFSTDCFEPASAIKTMDGSYAVSVCPRFTDLIDDGGFMLNNGMLMAFEDDQYDKYVFMDVNGHKPPNTLGRDIYVFRILANRIVPLGAPNSVSIPEFCSSTTLFTAVNSCSKSVSGSGLGCSAQLMTE